MPLVFIHGVNTRREGAEAEPYAQAEARRTLFLEQSVIGPLVSQGKLAGPIAIVSPYWGDLGVSFRWQQASLPPVEFLESLGGGVQPTPQADLELSATLKDIGKARGDELEALGPSAGPIKRAAEADLPRLTESLLAPIIHGERSLKTDPKDTPEMVGRREALLLIAANQVAHDPAIQAQVAAAATDAAVLDLLKRAIMARHRQLLVDAQDKGRLVVPAEDPAAVQLDALGLLDNLRAIVTQGGQIIDRAAGAAGRAASVAALDLWREGLHKNFTRFLGDVFVYLNERDGLGGTLPETIVQRVLAAIEGAPRADPNEPLIVVTHSMGGNVFYDIVTNYAPALQVACWISVASQVGPFEEMKLFKKSQRALGQPNHVAALPNVGHWLNVYDPADVLSFLAAPVFTGPHDVLLKTGESTLKAHSEYFNRPRFYEIVLEHLQQALP
jgi:hypothetical protein